MADKLTPKQARFVKEYAIDMNATQAAIRAGYSAKTAMAIGPENLKKPIVAAAIADGQRSLAVKAEISAVDVLKRWAEIATADPNELIQHRRAPCRHCNGKGHAHQWKTRREYDEACREAELAEKPKPSQVGGYGYSVKAPINPDCPECNGDGVGYVYAVDTRHLGRQARVLYAGVKQTKDGLEIKLHDQGKALENVARHLGMFGSDTLNINLKATVEVQQARAEARERLVTDLGKLAQPKPLTIDEDGNET